MTLSVGHLTLKIVPKMIYNVSSGTLNPSIHGYQILALLTYLLYLHVL